MRRHDVGHHEEHPARRARRVAVVERPIPKWTEHAEPGGVNCTARKESLTTKSAYEPHQPRLV